MRQQASVVVSIIIDYLDRALYCGLIFFCLLCNIINRNTRRVAHSRHGTRDGSNWVIRKLIILQFLSNSELTCG